MSRETAGYLQIHGRDVAIERREMQKSTRDRALSTVFVTVDRKGNHPGIRDV